MVPASPSAQAARSHRLRPDGADEQLRAARLHRCGPTGSTDSVIFSPAHTRFMTATRSAMPRMV